MFGQAGFFLRAKERNEQAIERYTTESNRLLMVLERRLAEEPFLEGDYSIADIATFTWVRAFQLGEYEFWQQGFAQVPKVRNWYEAIAARPAVVRALQLTKENCQ